MIRARPICLIKELGKLFKRIIVGRMNAFVEDSPRAALSNMQFGFRQGKSTMDSLNSVVEFIYQWTRKKHYVISVELDVTNAFNDIPWPAIRNGLRAKKFPNYIRRILDSYLYEKTVEYPIRGGKTGRRYISRGVPQGSILGSLLWNITFNYVLEVRPHSKC